MKPADIDKTLSDVVTHLRMSVNTKFAGYKHERHWVAAEELERVRTALAADYAEFDAVLTDKIGMTQDFSRALEIGTSCAADASTVYPFALRSFEELEELRKKWFELPPEELRALRARTP